MGNLPRNLSTDLSKRDVLAYIRDHADGVGKRELSRDLAIGAKKRNWLKNQLTDLLSEGMIALNRNGVYIAAQTLPRVAVLKVTGTDAGGDALAVPINWQEDREPPLIFVNPARTSRTSPGIGDRVLARLTRAENDTYRADIIRRLEGGPQTILGIFGEDGRIHPVARGKRFDYEVAPKDTMSADPGELVIAEVLPKKRLGLTQSKVLERLGKGEGPQAFSHIAVHMHEIPHQFSADVLAEAEACGRAPASGRVDLRDIPLVTIDGGVLRASRGRWRVCAVLARSSELPRVMQAGEGASLAVARRGGSGRSLAGLNLYQVDDGSKVSLKNGVAFLQTLRWPGARSLRAFEGLLKVRL